MHTKVRKTLDKTNWISKDVIAFSLHYYNGDYTPIGGTAITPAMGIDFTNTALNTGIGNALNLYNGNIRFMQTTLTDIATRDSLPMLNAYKYDQLNRLLEARSYTDGLSGNVWNPTSYGGKYFNKFTYDANGNILTQQRRNSTGAMLDSLTYHYLLDDYGNLIRNRLYHVNDSAGFQNAGDLTDQGTFVDTSYFAVENHNNYKYDEEGRLIQDLAEGIEEIVWRVDGKVKKVIFTSVSGKNNIEFDYDAFGRRVAKHLWTQSDVLVKSTYYILDAQGNQLLTFEHVVEDEESNYQLSERVIYGSSRLGTNTTKVDMLDDEPEEILSLELGNKLYEMSNHLGNVLTLINDIKIPVSSNSVDIDGYLATIVSTADYSPFGVQLDGRTVSAELYKYGYQGSEKDDEIKGEGNSYTTEFRMLDPRLGRWLSIDPLAEHFPWQSPYCSMDNNPIWLNDIYGDSTDTSTDAANNSSFDSNTLESGGYPKEVKAKYKYYNQGPDGGRVLDSGRGNVSVNINDLQDYTEITDKVNSITGRNSLLSSPTTKKNEVTFTTKGLRKGDQVTLSITDADGNVVIVYDKTINSFRDKIFARRLTVSVNSSSTQGNQSAIQADLSVTRGSGNRNEVKIFARGEQTATVTHRKHFRSKGHRGKRLKNG